MTEESFVHKLLTIFNIESNIESSEAIDVYFRNTYGVAFSRYTDGSICIKDKKFIVGEATWNEVEDYIKTLPLAEVRIKESLSAMEDMLSNLQNVADSLTAREKWSQLDEAHEIFKLNLKTIKNSIDSLNAITKLIDINRKPYINPLPHYSEHIKEQPHGT
jgi:hypothetical protein